MENLKLQSQSAPVPSFTLIKKIYNECNFPTGPIGRYSNNHSKITKTSRTVKIWSMLNIKVFLQFTN